MYDVRDRKPAWRLLYAIALVLVGLLWLVETSVPNGIARIVLELAVVTALFTLVMSWVRHNRLVIEVDEQCRRVAYSVTAAADRRTPIAVDARLSNRELSLPPSVRSRG